MLKSALLSCLCSISLLQSAQALTQPKTIPEGYLMVEQEMPPLDWVINRPRPTYSVYGIYTWFGEYRKLRKEIKQVGWGTLRLSGPMTDDDLKIAFDDGLNFTYMINHPKGKRDSYKSDEAYIKASVIAANTFLDRYGKNGSFYKEYPKYKGLYIPFMQLRNEPNFHYMYKNGSEAERQKLYANLAPQLQKLIKKKSPKTKIVGFTTGGAGAGDMRFVKSVLEHDKRCLTETDVFATHPYVQPAPPEANKKESWGSYSIANSLNTLRKIFNKYEKKDITVWYTEGGYMISKADGGAYEKPANSTVSLELQAAYNCRYYAIALRLGVDCVTTMFITDTDGYPGGFFDRLKGMQWRPSAHAVQNMIRIMPHPALRGAQSDGEDGIYVYEFVKHAHKEASPNVIMAYRVEGPKTVTIKVPSKKTKVTDMLGKVTIINTPNNVLEHEIGPLPIYIEESN